MADNDFATKISRNTSDNSQTNVVFAGISDGTDLALVDASGNLQTILAANSGVDIGDVDVTSVIPGTGATNLGKAEDAAHTTGDTGVMALAVRDDTGATLSSATGDYEPLHLDANGNLRTTASVTINSEKTDDSAFTVASDTVSVNGYLADDTTPDSVDEGDVGAARMTLDRKQLMVLVDSSTDSQRLAIDASGNANAILAANDGVDIGDVTINNAGGASAVNIQDGGNSITVDGTVTASLAASQVDDSAFTVATDEVLGIGFLADDTTPDSVDEGDIGIPRMTLDRKVLTRVVGATDGNRLDVDASGHAQVDLAAVSVTAVPVSKDSSANSETNPIWVQNVTTELSGAEVHDYNTATVSGGGTDNHDYTVANTTFMLKAIDYASSGALKIEVQTGPLASLVTKAVRFIPATGGGDQIVLDPPIEVPVTSTGTVRVIRTNRAPSSNDVYTTIIGKDV